MNEKPLITDEQSFDGATSRFGNAIQTYDDGYGPLWISRNSIGINGIVRARTWEDAYSICEDEFFPEASETIEEIVKEYGFRREHVKVVKDASVSVATEHCGVGERFATNADYAPKLVPQFVRWETVETPDPEAWSENELFQDAFGFRNNGPNERDTLKHGIYSKDLNCDALEVLTSELVTDLEITLNISDAYEVIVGNIGSVYSGTNLSEATKHFDEFVEQSKLGNCRASGEDVTLMKNDEPMREYRGTHTSE